MAAITITGRICDATGAGVANALLRLSPAPASPEPVGEAIGGIGLILDPVESVTAANGTFSLTAVQGFRYRLEIPSIGWDRTFNAPASASIRFDLLGLVPSMDSAPRGSSPSGVLSVFPQIVINSVNTVLERYDTLRLQRATSLAGAYTNVASTAILPNRAFYEIEDNPPNVNVFYRSRYENSVTAEASAWSDALSAAEEADESLLLSVDELKELYLFGVDLSDDYGRPFTRRMLEHYIRAGAGWLSKELDIPLVPVNIVEETHDHYAQDYGQWGFFQLRQYPVIEVTGVRFQYPSMQSSVTINQQWVVLTENGAHGQIQIVPGQGGIADVLLIPGALMPMWSGRSGRVPGIWRFDYRAGFEVGTLPVDLKHVLGMWAAIGPLNIAGDLVAGAAIATKSVSVPGLSQNIGTTASATNAGYGSRILEYQKEIKQQMPNLRRFYGKTTRLVVT